MVGNNVLEMCALFGKLDILIWFHDDVKFCSIEQNLIFSSKEENVFERELKIDIERYYVSQDDPPDINDKYRHRHRHRHRHRRQRQTVNWSDIIGRFSNIGLNAARSDHLDILIWAQKHNSTWDYRITKTAAKFGYLDVLKYCLTHWRILFGGDVCEKAAESGNLEVLKWLWENKLELDEDTCKGAASGGFLEILKWARKNNCPWNEETCNAAAKGGFTQVLKFARDNDCPWSDVTCSSAATGGHLSTLQFARKNGCTWDSVTCTKAATGGHFEVLKWARENGCPWNIYTCEGAARGNHISILKWAHENGCPWNYLTVEWIVFNGNFEALKWIYTVDKSILCNISVIERASICYTAIKGNHLEIAKWLTSITSEFGFELLNNNFKELKLCKTAAANGNLKMLSWLIENGQKIDIEVYESAASGGHINILEFGKENNWLSLKHLSREHNFWNMSIFATERGHLHVLKWLHKNIGFIEDSCFGAAIYCGYFDIVKWLMETSSQSNTFDDFERRE